MRRKNIICFVFLGITALFLVGYSVVSAATKVVVIPLSKTAATSCTAPDEVKSAGYCWKDRNLGATRVALSSTDTHAYGSRYQWGRLGDGHQNETSATTATLSLSDVPGHSDFITNNSSSSYYDWRIPQNNNLWQGVSGDNNPCPQGFRLPTETELTAERTSWTYGNNAFGAFKSPLNLVVAGIRSFDSLFFYGNDQGIYWSSTVSTSLSRCLWIYSNNASMLDCYRAFGLSVRCIKD